MLQQVSPQWQRSIHSKAAASSRTSFLEVEKKFRPTADLNGFLNKCVLSSKVRSAKVDLAVTRLPDSIIRDIYYDLNDDLSAKGIWIRRRETRCAGGAADHLSGKPSSTTWEAKIQVAGTYTDTQAVEVEGKEQILHVLRERVPNVDPQSLEVLVDVQTFRRSWLVQEEDTAATTQNVLNGVQNLEMRIDLDTVTAPWYTSTELKPFHHEVGEIELTGTILNAGVHDYAKLRRQVTQSMQAKIQRFFEKHSDLFSTVPTQGKLSAFFAWKEMSNAKLIAVEGAGRALADD